MTNKSVYVALRAFRFGVKDLQPGDPVPVEAGRDYQQMLRVGQIGPAGVTAPVGQQEPGEPPPLTPYAQGDPVVFVADDGAHTFVTFVEAMEAPEEAREGLGLDNGDLVAAVTFPEDPDTAVLVPLDSLLPEQPTARLIEDLQAQGQERAAGQGADAQVQALQGKVSFLELLVQAIRTGGTPLKADTPALRDLQHNGILTEEGLRLLAEGEGGQANLEALDRVGAKKAAQLREYLGLTAAKSPPEG